MKSQAISRSFGFQEANVINIVARSQQRKSLIICPHSRAGLRDNPVFSCEPRR